MEDQISLLIEQTIQEIEKVSSDMTEAIQAAYAAVRFHEDSTANNKQAGILLAVSAMQSFSEHIIEICEEFVSQNPESTFVNLYKKTEDFHSDLLKNLKTFEQSYKEQLSLYGQ
jgi:ElaB/YqjD/DUF883 family membrane-anchored ribosome-binding protein